MVYNSYKLIIRGILFSLLLVIISTTTTYAKTIERGKDATINWSVLNATDCDANSTYTGNPNDIIDQNGVQWNGSRRAGNGSATFASIKTVDTFSFTCTRDSVTGSDTLTVEDCGGSLSLGRPSWNGSACVAADPTASLKITAGSYGTNVSTISYPAGTANTKTWSSTNGATYSDRYRLTGSCANNSWNTDTAWKVFGTFTSASGNSNTNAQEGDVGCVRNTDYVVKNGTKSATSSIQETVTRCLDGKYFTAGSGCVACGNSGCTGTGGSVSDPDGSLSCTNGSTIKPACTLNPVIDTPTASNITSTGATLGANFRSAGTKTITERGTCWGSLANPSSNCVAEGSTATGVFSHARGSMLANTTYHYRGFVRDSGGTYYYSADATFTTAAAGGMSGTLSASPEACTILNGASTCWSLFTWTTTNATSGVSQVVGDGGGPSSNSVNNGSQSLQARYIPNAQYPNPHTFRLYNNSKELATVNVTADCASGSVWDGDSCEACQNGGCTNHVCNNGSTIKPACTLNPVIDTPTASNITSTGATLGANFRSAGTKTITERGTCWGSLANPSSNCVAEGSTATGVFSHARGSMLANTTYHYRGFVRDSGGTYYYSADATFTTAAAGGMSGTLSASPEACTILNGASTCWSLFTWTTTNATSGVSQVVGDGGGPSSNSVNNGSQSLQARYIPNAQYPNPHTFRLYNNSKELATVNVTADCASGSVWDGDSCEACQNGGCTNHVCNNGSTIKPACTLNPVIDTPTASNITSTGATLGANFRSAGTKTITERGTCWGSVVDPLTNCSAETTNAGGVSTGVFSHARGGSMLANTTYHYRGFVRDSGGTYYFSADATFTTTAPSAMSGTLSASPEACTILNGASTCWSLFTWTTTNATSGVSQVVGDGGGPSSNSVNNGSQSLQARYILDIPGAQYPKPHIFRLYNNSKELATVNVTADCASNSAWDGDSCEACQGSGCTNHVCNNGSTIKPACTLNPVIDTPTASNITSTGATLGANFRSAGTKTITERGTCWGSVVDPLTNCSAETTNAGGVSTGVFSHARGGSMLANTTYHYRGFVRDSGGTYYFSADATFTTTAPADSCGTGNGTIQNPDAQPSGGVACSSGTFTDAADTAAAWNWKCGSLSCSAPKWGCNVSTDTNYDAFGADNAWKCAGTCKNGHANYPTCPGTMTGTLTAPSGTTCTIADDATNCAVTLYWKVTNPESATTQIVRDSDSAVIYSPQHEDTKSVSAFGYLSPSRHSLKNNGVTLKTIDVTGQCNTGRHVHTDNRCRLMSGTLTSSANSCVISSGNSTCNVSLSWSVSYPQNAGGSSVTRTGNVNVKINDDSENNYSVAVPYSGSGITYYLYNNTVELATKVITTSCANGTSWDGDNCAPNAGPTASFTNEPFSCTVSSGNSSCNPTLTWTSANITPVILTDCSNGIYGSYLTGDQSASVFSGYTGGCYRVQYGGVNNAGVLVGGTILDTTNTTASCANGTSWDGDSCEPNACANGATNPPTCDICPADRVMDAGSCVVCLNGGCTDGSCNNGGANPPVCTPPSCANGATNPPTCDICPADRVMDAGSCVVCGNGGCAGGNCNNGSVTKPACTLPTGSLSVAPLSCSIATGDSTCQVRATWSTQDPIGTSQITHNSPNGTIVYTANSGVNQPINLTAAKSTVKIFLYNNGEPPLDSEDVSVACTAGPGKWDSVGGKCVDPEVTGVVKTGEYGFPGFPPNINFICSSANAWKILKNGVLEIDNTVYSGPQDFTPDASATYTIICKHGNVESDPWSVYFDMVPKSPKALLNISPVTIEKGGQTVLTWAIQYPDNTCTLSAKVLCVNNSCSQEQKDYEKGINDILSSPAEETDGNDPNGKRNLRTSLRNFAPGHSPTDNPTDYKALGKKTVRQIRYTTEFTAACQTGTKETKRVNVSTSNEG